jgi:inorganic phosphate transporter, PiT family
MPDGTTLLLGVTIAIALGFDFTNGFHDTANAVATTVSTRAMSPRLAVLMSAALNLVGAVVATQVFHNKVSNTIGGLVHPGTETVALKFVVAALLSAIVWNLVTWRAGLPSSSSHALIGALVGMGLTGYGVHAIAWDKVVPTIIALVTSPIAGMLLAAFVMVAILNLLKRAHPHRVNVGFRGGQILSGAWVSFAHGSNDAQKTMGVMTLTLLGTGHLHEGPNHAFPGPPLWVVVLAALAIGLGTYAGGWRIIRTMGSRIIKLEPVDGFVAQTMSAVVIQAATQINLPVSTTHVVSGGVMGAGSPRHFGAVRWSVARSILGAWILTIPATALIAAVITLLFKL